MPATASATVLVAACLEDSITNRNNHISVTLQKVAEASTATDAVANVLRTTFLCCKHIFNVVTLEKSCHRNECNSNSGSTCLSSPVQCNKT